MYPNPYQQYRSLTVETANPVQVVAMLYQGVVRFTQRAMIGVEQRDIQTAHDNFLRAQAIVVELQSHLDMAAGGEVARNLAALYDYAYRKLVEANCQKAVEPAMEVVAIFRELHGAWQQLAERSAAGIDGQLATTAPPRLGAR